jgi:flavin reductase (DIM6/NTAB) family NADH-FMN oxidoreductase RutF
MLKKGGRMFDIDPSSISVMDRQKILTSGIGPRPIALVSTINENGQANLSPFSFFNAFGANPPILAFSPARRGRDGSLKDTYHNIEKNKECVVAVVSFDMVEQISLASSEYESSVDEFIKSGLSKVNSNKIKAYGVKEAPLWMECKVNQIINLGESNGSGNLIIAEVIMFHISEHVFENGVINPDKADIVGRFGENYYVRASAESIFEVAKPVGKGIGMDQLPAFMKESHIYSANNLARFANTETIPNETEIIKYLSNLKVSESFNLNEFERLELNEMADDMISLALAAEKSAKKLYIERTAKIFLEKNDFDLAWKTAMIANR